MEMAFFVFGEAVQILFIYYIFNQPKATENERKKDADHMESP